MKRATFGRFSGQAAFIGVAVLLLLAAAVLGAIGWRAYAEVSGQAARYRDYRALQRDAGKADSLSAVYENIRKEIQGIREALPAQNQGSQVLNILVEDARKLDLGIAGINALDEIPFPGYKELPFEINLTGGFANLVRYLHSLETRGMVLEVRSLSAHAEAINKSQVTAKLELSVFVPGEGRAETVPATVGAAP
ncbi:MAG: Pilus assembly protein PilO [Fibrobacteres bacterium]|nr:Pilus assembly protein PilO [Fibrobacterota bacterium]